MENKKIRLAVLGCGPRWLGLASIYMQHPDLDVVAVCDIADGAAEESARQLKENFGCDKCGKASLADRKGMRFPMMREWGHRNLIFNSAHTYMGDRADELRSARIRSEHYIFSVESASEIRSLLSAKKKGAPLGAQVRRIGKR